MNLFILPLLIALPLLADEVKPPRSDEWKLVWSGEFDQDGPPNPDLWDFEKGFQRNNELQWYQPQNTACRDCNLIIEARAEKVKNPDYREGDRNWKRSRRQANSSTPTTSPNPSTATPPP